MPLFIPILIGAGVAIATAMGGKKGYDGVKGIRGAKKLSEEAKKRHERHARILDSSREHLSRRLQDLHELRQETALETFGRMIELLQALERRGRVKSERDLERMGGNPEEVKAFVGSFVEAGGLLKGGVAAVGMASGASAAATGLVSTFATASTGTAISGLSGAAANSAIMAWLGGGSLAAGGWGMAGGAAVLGGIAVAPAVLVGGVVLAAQGEKARTQAIEYSEKVNVSIQRMGALVAVLRRTEKRVEELSDLTVALSNRADGAMDRLEELVPSFDENVPAHIECLRVPMLLCAALRQLIDCRVLDDDGQLDASSEALLQQYRALVDDAPEVVS